MAHHVPVPPLIARRSIGKSVRDVRPSGRHHVAPVAVDTQVSFVDVAMLLHGTTATATLPVTSSAAAEMVAEPGATPRVMPVPLTVTNVGADVDQENVFPAISIPA